MFFLTVLCAISTAFSQTKAISGKVVDENNTPIEGASIVIKGGTRGTSSDAAGNFTLNATAADVLVISAVNFANTEVRVGKESFITISLKGQLSTIEEVVVTAVGINRAQKTLGYSASTIKGDDLLKARETNVLNGMAGKISNVRINSQSGTLGGSAKIVIRGVNSLDGNSVLFVIDGMTVGDATSAGGTTSNNVDYGNRMGDLSPDDIESMTVLKGAAATALYGSRAKDGAVIITTKRGKKGARTAVSVNSSVRFDSPLVLPEFQNDYAQGNYGVYDLKYTNGWGPKIADVQNKKFIDFMGDSVNLRAYPDNVKDFFKTGVSNINNVSFSGGGDNSDYRMSFTAVNETGIIPNTKLNKYNISLNSGREFSPKFSTRFSTNYTRISSDGRPAQSSNNANILTSAIYGLPRVVDINKLRDNYINPTTGDQIFLSTDKTGNNPFWIMNFNRNSNTVDRFLGTFTLNYKPFSWMTVTDNLGGDIYTEKRSSVTRKGTAGNINGSFTNADIYSRQINNDLLVTLEKRNLVKELSVKLILGHNVNERETRTTTVQANNLTIDQLYTYSNAASTTSTLGYSKRRLYGVYGDLGLSYRDFLFLNVTGRNDWTSTLPVANRSYFYPSVSSSFIFSEFTKSLSWLSYGKVRASWASVGSDLAPYQLDFQYSPVTTVFLQYLSNNTVFPFAPINTAFTGPRILPNANLVPQRQNSYELGTDLKFLKNRIGLGFTYYNTATKKQLIPIDVAISTGYFSKYVNVGLIRNKGIEVDLNLQVIKEKNFGWNVDVNFGKNKQVVEELAEGLNQYSLASGWSGLQIKAEKGQTFGLYGTAWQRDTASGQFVINTATGLRNTVANQRLGNIYPDWTMGINNSFSYKGISLSALLDIRKGGVFYSGTVAALRSSGLAKETDANRGKIFVDKGVMDDGTGKLVANTVPVQSMQDFWGWYSSTTNTEGNVFDASFVKLREVRVAYAFPAKLLGKSFIKGAEIGLEGRNLWLIKSHVPHVDPEMNFFGAGSIGEGVEFNSVPSARSWGANVRLTF